MLVWYLKGPYLTLRCEIPDGHLTGPRPPDRSNGPSVTSIRGAKCNFLLVLQISRFLKATGLLYLSVTHVASQV